MNRRIILVVLATALSAAGAPVFFPRAQFHYGLERTDYLHRWYDRPLCQDSTFADANDSAHPINEKSWRETVRALRLGKCGIGTFIDQRIRADVIPRSVLPGAETVFLAEFDSVHSGEDRLQHILRTAELAIAAPNAFRLDGRVVMTEYGAKTFTPEDLAFYDKVRAALAEKLNAAFEQAYAQEDRPPWERYSASAGMSDCEAGDTELDQVLRRADKAMYAVKQAFKAKHGSYR